MNIVLGIFTFVLIVISILLILVVLMQKSPDGGGLSPGLGGGMAESTFGADSDNMLVKMTRNLTIAFFVLCLGLYLGNIYVRKHAQAAGSSLPVIAAPATGTPTQTAPQVALPAEPGNAQAAQKPGAESPKP